MNTYPTARQALSRMRNEAEPTPIDAAIEALRKAAAASTRPDSEILRILETAAKALAGKEEEPTTPADRLSAIRMAVAAVGGDNALAELYIRGNKPLTVIKSELLPLAALARQFGRI